MFYGYERKRIVIITGVILMLMFLNYSLEHGTARAVRESLQLLLVIPAALVAIVFHEVAHGYAAYTLGDPTAKITGRLTLNPLKHLDPLGVLAIFLIKFGWAKPVPVNYRYLGNPRRDIFLVSMAGPATNILIAILALMLLKTCTAYIWPHGDTTDLLGTVTCAFFTIMAVININFAVFNLLPIPPLDGSKMLMMLMPPRMAREFEAMESTGWIVLLLFLLFGGFEKVLLPFSVWMLQMLSSLLGL